MLQDITRTIPAGETSIFDVAGGSLACIAANLADFQIRFDNDGEATFRVGFEYTPPNGFNKFQVRNTRTAPLTVTFTVAVGQFRDRRQISSAPQSFEPVTLDDLTGVSYFGATAVAATAGNSPTIRIGNPADSGIVTVIRTLWVAATIVADIEIQAQAAAASGTLEGNVQPTISGDPAGSTQLYTTTSLGTPGILGGFPFRVRVPADQSYRVPLQAPIVLAEGHRCQIRGSFLGAANILRAAADILELPAG